MGFGTSLGTAHEDEISFVLDNGLTEKQKADQAEIKANTTSGDFQSKFYAADQSTMPPGSLRELAGALKQTSGTQVAPTDNERTKGLSLLKNAMYGELDPEDGSYYRTDMYNTVNASTGIRQYSYETPLETKDYDYDAWQKANPGVQMAPGQHYPDTFKLPNHMTFSDESMYHGGENQGGHWGTDDQGNDTFTPGRTNLEQHSMSDLRDYFSRVEPNAKLLPPDIDDVPHHDWVEGLFQSAKDAFKLPGEVFGGKVDPTSQQGIEKSLDLASMMVFGPAPVAAKMAEGTLGSFMGVKSKTFNKENLYKAQNMEFEGRYFDQSKGGSQLQTTAHPDDIWQETRTFRGADNRWRQEIPDVDAKLRDSAFDKKTIPGEPSTTVNPDAPKGWGDIGGTEDREVINLKQPTVENTLSSLFRGKPKTPDLESVLDHPELYKAYPELRGIKVEPFPYKTNSYGVYSPGNNAIYLNKDLDPEFARGVILHEAQHAIQDIEGFARGGNAKEFLPPEFTQQKTLLDKTEESLLKELKERGLDDRQIQTLQHVAWADAEGTVSPEIKNIVDTHKANPDYLKIKSIEAAKQAIVKAQEEAHDKYQRLAGEVEARNVQTRRQYSELRRWAYPPSETADIPLKDQIVVDNGSPNFSEHKSKYNTEEDRLVANQAFAKKREELDLQRRQGIKEDLKANPIEDNIRPRSPTKYIDELIAKDNAGTLSITEGWILKRLLKDRYKP